MSPRQKAVGYVVFLVSLAAISMMLVFVGGPVVRRLSKLDANVHAHVDVFRDEEHRVTCWISSGSISCLRDKEIK